MKKIKAQISDLYNSYQLFIKNSLIKNIRKIQLFSLIRKTFISFISLNFMVSKKFNVSIFNRYLILSIILLFSFLFYLSIPTLYNYGELQKQLTKKLEEEFNLNISLSANITYKILPSPNFEISNVLLNTNKDNEINDLAQIKKMKIFVYTKNLQNQKKIEIKNIIFTEANIDINKNSFEYLVNYFDGIISKKKIQIKKSKLFFREDNSQKEVITLSKINKSNLFLDLKKNQKKIIVDGSIYNTRYNLTLYRNIYKRNTTNLKISFKKLNTLLKNIINKNPNDDHDYGGSTSVKFTGSEINLNYTISNKLITFTSYKSKLNNDNFNFQGKINISPFYYNLKIDVENLNALKVIEDLAKLKNLLDEKILLNKNLNGNILINAKLLKGIKFFDNAIINLTIINGKIILDKSTLISTKIGNVSFTDAIVETINGNKIFKAKILFTINNQRKFYQKLQVPKSSRIKLKNIYFDIEKDINIEGIEIKKMLFNKDKTKNYKDQNIDLFKFIDVEEINSIKNWIELKKFSKELLSEISETN
tara:strand:+ start:1512 stop:3113 length:1602 start_codon:yes stop_codon:yes gene_type:complete